MKKQKAKRKAKLWAKGEDILLLRLVKKRLPHKEIAVELDRTIDGVEKRLQKLRGK